MASKCKNKMIDEKDFMLVMKMAKEITIDDAQIMDEGRTLVGGGGRFDTLLNFGVSICL